ncbi:hypothetical protein [Collimonas sp.]|jgi:hypothetical protein
MYIVAIAWICVVFMMAITESSVIAALMTFELPSIFRRPTGGFYAACFS